MGNFITFPEMLLWLPLLGGIICFFAKKEEAVKLVSLATALCVLAVMLVSLRYTSAEFESYNVLPYIWMKYLGSVFYLSLDGSSRVLVLLTTVSFPIIFITSYRNSFKSPNAFYGLMLLMQCGLTGVFLAKDALLFYFFWELALIPAYFLCSKWGGERRIQATFKFFVYTFLASLLMLCGIIFIYLHTPSHTAPDGTFVLHTFSISTFYTTAASFNESTQSLLFWLFFAAFAVKMPIFPFHTWQPDTYDQAPSPVTMALSGVMVKMGLFGVIRWLLPMFPMAVPRFTPVVMTLCITGIIYASCLALVQDNIKKLVAYSSIAHVGLMCAGLFAMTTISVQGVMLQMFNHGINIIGLWIIAGIIERQTGVKNISQFGGVAQKAPVLTVLLIIVAFANIALPLTNAFIGEFMMFSGVFQYGIWAAAISGLGIILAACYTLGMIRRVFYGETNPLTETVRDLKFNEALGLSLIVAMIFALGVFPQPMIDLTKTGVAMLVGK